MKILVVDDNTEVRRLIRSLLTGLADEIYECDDGAEAVELSLMYRPDWILMDVFMKKMDGLAAAEAIKKTFPQVKIAIVTNHTDKRTRRAAAEVGADAFFGKDDLLAMVALLNEEKKNISRGLNQMTRIKTNQI